MPGFDKEIAKMAQRILINPRKIDWRTGVLATKVTPGREGVSSHPEFSHQVAKDPPPLPFQPTRTSSLCNYSCLHCLAEFTHPPPRTASFVTPIPAPLRLTPPVQIGSLDFGTLQVKSANLEHPPPPPTLVRVSSLIPAEPIGAWGLLPTIQGEIRVTHHQSSFHHLPR